MTGIEPLVGESGEEIGSVSEFWEWGFSNLLNNLERGILAEYIVCLALGQADEVRESWDPYDVTTKTGAKVEVKSGAYIQSWFQKRHSRIDLSVRATTAWSPHTNESVGEKKRQSDVYVFGILDHLDQETVNPLDLRQWKFLVLSTAVLNSKLPNRKTLSLSALEELGYSECTYSGLESAIEKELVRTV